jgi:hypothetical protein
MIPHHEALGAPVTDLDDYVAAREHAPCRPELESAIADAVAHDHGIVRRFWWLGPALAVVVAGAWLIGRSPAPLPAPTAPALAAAPAGLTGFAEMYVAAHLTGADASTMRSFTAEPATARVNAYDRYVTGAAAVAVAPIGDDYWTVTVAADVLPRIDGGYGPGTLEYFAVAVAVVGSGYLATGTPLPVAAPVATVPYAVYGELRTEGDDSMVAFMKEFLDAYLGGSGRIPRLVTPDSAISAVLPAPAATVDVTSVKVGDIGGITWATASAAMTDANGSVLPVTITVRLAATTAGVRVAEMLPGPPPLPAAGN